MKQPRTSDFDPNDQPPSLKSSMDDFPTIEKAPPQSVEAETLMVSTPPPVRPVREVLPIPGQRRKIKSRHPFDIYEDQAETLKQLSIEDRMRGGNGSMSAMVREAIDAYIAQKRSQ